MPASSAPAVTEPVAILGATTADAPALAAGGPGGTMFRKVKDVLERYVAQPPLRGRQRQAFMAGIVGAALAVSVVDVATGQTVALDVLYVLPVVLATARVSARFGTLVAVESATIWMFVNTTEIPRPSIGTSIADLVLRTVILIVIVAIVSALQEALVATRASARQAKDFLGYAAHQIRTPLTGLRTCAETLVLSGVSPTQERLLAHIGAETQRMGRLLTSMLRLARLDQGEVFERRAVDLAHLCRSTVASAQGASERQPTVHLTVPSPPCVAVVSDEAVGEALANLVDNALRHALARVDVSLRTTGGLVEIAVLDDGPGLPPGAEAQAFDRFVSLDGQGGSGLGLAIALALVEGQGGTLGYRGGRFVISLPLGA